MDKSFKTYTSSQIEINIFNSDYKISCADGLEVNKCEKCKTITMYCIEWHNDEDRNCDNIEINDMLYPTTCSLCLKRYPTCCLTDNMFSYDYYEENYSIYDNFCVKCISNIDNITIKPVNR